MILLPALLVILGVAGLAWRLWPRSRPFASITVNQITNIGSIEKIALSADGRFLAEVKNDKGQRTLWIRNIVTNTDTQILGAIDAEYIGLTFSPDSNYLYFNRQTPENRSVRAIYSMPAFGGTPKQIVYDADSSVSFAPDGQRFTYVRWTPARKDQYSEVHIANKDGTGNQVIYSSTTWVDPPVWSPDGLRLGWLGTATGSLRMVLGLMDLSSRKVTMVRVPAGIFLNPNPDGYTNLAWLPDNRHLLTIYYKAHTERSQIGIVTVTGDFHPVTNDVNAYGQLALSSDGRSLATVLTNVDSGIAFYKPEGGSPIAVVPLRITPTSIAWIDEDRLAYIARHSSIGTISRTTGEAQNFDIGDIEIGSFVATCADGHILFTGVHRNDAEARLFRMNAEGGDIAQLTSTGVARAPSCSPDSKQVYYSARIGDQASLWSVPIGGGTPKQLLAAGNYYSAAVSPDFKLAQTLQMLEQTKTVSVVTDLATGHPLPPLATDSSAGAIYTHFTPDNRALLYGVRRDGGNSLLYQPIDGSSTRLFLDPVAESIRDFAWSPSGKQLAVTRLKSSSDVVLITDQSGKTDR